VVNISVQIGYESHMLPISNEEWEIIKAGKSFAKDVESYYEGEAFTYEFKFNMDSENSLIVSYYGEDMDSGDGYIGNIEDATIEFLD
jgi:hypothetical protein